MGKKFKFRDFRISRSIVPKKTGYKNYKGDLRKDFNSRCGYCNAKELEITSFCVDHFVPQRVCVGQYISLLDDYNNLVFSCPICNSFKKGKFEGDLSHNKYDNKLFYNPVEIDFGSIFYRNEIGVICSDDEKGKEMLVSLRLYSIIHALEWAKEYADNLIKKIEQLKQVKKIEQNNDLESLLTQLYEKIYNINCLYEGKYRILSKMFFEQG